MIGRVKRVNRDRIEVRRPSVAGDNVVGDSHAINERLVNYVHQNATARIAQVIIGQITDRIAGDRRIIEYCGRGHQIVCTARPDVDALAVERRNRQLLIDRTDVRLVVDRAVDDVVKQLECSDG